MKKRTPPLRWVVYLLLLTMLATGVSLSRYKTTIAGSGSVSVARPVVTYVAVPDSTNPARLNGIAITPWTGALTGLKPGDRLTVPFSVRNYDGAGISQVLMQYQLSAAITTITGQTQPQYTWSIATYPAGANYGAVGGWTPIGFGSPIEHKYTLTIEWPTGTYGTEYMNKSQTVSIIVNAVQVNN